MSRNICRISGNVNTRDVAKEFQLLKTYCLFFVFLLYSLNSQLILQHSLKSFSTNLKLTSPNEKLTLTSFIELFSMFFIPAAQLLQVIPSTFNIVIFELELFI